MTPPPVSLAAAAAESRQIKRLLASAGYKSGPAGVSVSRNNREAPVCRVPIRIEAVVDDVDTGQRRARIAWQDGPKGSQWRRLTVGVEHLTSARMVRGLAALGVPVDEGTARELAVFLGVYLSALVRLGSRRERTSTRAGWHDGIWLRPGGVEGDLRHEAVPGCVAWARNAGAESGTLDDWRSGVLPLLERAESPSLALALAASLAAPVVGRSGEPGWIVQIAGPSDSGKSTCARVAAALWGAAGELESWGDRPGGREALWASYGRGFPGIVDDTEAADGIDLEASIYSWASGRGRRRGLPTGGASAEPVTFSTVLLTTGEVPITADAKRAGAHRRALVFEDVSALPLAFRESRERMGELYRRIEAVHGVVGPAWIEHLSDPDRWADLERAAEWHALELDDTGSTAARHFGLLRAVSEAAAALRLVPAWSSSTWARAWVRIRDAARVGMDRPRLALQAVVAHLAAHAGKLATAANPNPEGHDGLHGAMTEHLIGVTSKALRTALQGVARDREALRAWRDRGWLVTQRSDELTTRIRIPGRSTPVVAYFLRRDVLAAEGLDLDVTFDPVDLDEGALPEAPSGPPTAPMHAEAPRPAPTTAAPSWADTGPIPTAAETATAGGALRRELAIMAPAANGPDYSTASSTRPPKGQALSAPPVSPDAGPPTLDDLDDLAAEPRRTDELPDLAADGAGADLDDDDEGSEA